MLFRVVVVMVVVVGMLKWPRLNFADCEIHHCSELVFDTSVVQIRIWHLNCPELVLTPQLYRSGFDTSIVHTRFWHLNGADPVLKPQSCRSGFDTSTVQIRFWHLNCADLVLTPQLCRSDVDTSITQIRFWHLNCADPGLAPQLCTSGFDTSIVQIRCWHLNYADPVLTPHLGRSGFDTSIVQIHTLTWTRFKVLAIPCSAQRSELSESNVPVDEKSSKIEVVRLRIQANTDMRMRSMDRPALHLQRIS